MTLMSHSKTQVFVHSASSDCAAVTPEKDVGAGHAMFTITTAGRSSFQVFDILGLGSGSVCNGLPGEYTLCYRSAGAQDSVAQNGEGVKLQARAVLDLPRMGGSVNSNSFVLCGICNDF